MNVYVCYNGLGNLQIIYGDYFKAKRVAASEIRLLGNNDVDDVIYGRVPFLSLNFYSA